jgi:hypothetical protein
MKLRRFSPKLTAWLLLSGVILTVLLIRSKQGREHASEIPSRSAVLAKSHDGHRERSVQISHWDQVCKLNPNDQSPGLLEYRRRISAFLTARDFAHWSEEELMEFNQSLAEMLKANGMDCSLIYSCTIEEMVQRRPDFIIKNGTKLLRGLGQSFDGINGFGQALWAVSDHLLKIPQDELKQLFKEQPALSRSMLESMKIKLDDVDAVIDTWQLSQAFPDPDTSARSFLNTLKRDVKEFRDAMVPRELSQHLEKLEEYARKNDCPELRDACRECGLSVAPFHYLEKMEAEAEGSKAIFERSTGEAFIAGAMEEDPERGLQVIQNLKASSDRDAMTYLLIKSWLEYDPVVVEQAVRKNLSGRSFGIAAAMIAKHYQDQKDDAMTMAWALEAEKALKIPSSPETVPVKKGE